MASQTEWTGVEGQRPLTRDDADEPYVASPGHGAPRRVWVVCPRSVFRPGTVVEEDELTVVVRTEDDAISRFGRAQVFSMNPARFERAEDLASLSHLNEPSVLYNLEARYASGETYTYSGLFLVAVNPFRSIPNVYGEHQMHSALRRRPRQGPPHIYAVAAEAYRSLMETSKSQSILVTGESGAGKTENTRHVIEFLVHVSSLERSKTGRHEAGKKILRSAGRTESGPRKGACDEQSKAMFSGNTASCSKAASSAAAHASFAAEQALRAAHPLLEAFGNARTVRNDNSSRFGKFVQIQFEKGAVCGARIESYLLEKTRAARPGPHERNFHSFYSLLAGASDSLLEQLGLVRDASKYRCLYNAETSPLESVCRLTREDAQTFAAVEEAFEDLHLDSDKYWRTLAAILHLSNVKVVEKAASGDDRRCKKASLDELERQSAKASQEDEGCNSDDNSGSSKAMAVSDKVSFVSTEREAQGRKSEDVNNLVSSSLAIADMSLVAKVCELLGVSEQTFVEDLLCPSIQAGRTAARRIRSRSEAQSVLEGLQKNIYEALFLRLVSELNSRLGTSSDFGGSPSQSSSSSTTSPRPFIGVLDIAGFEILNRNSFEQFCINHTNERLQQFFNRHMFVLERELYQAEGIADSVEIRDFGQDLEPTLAAIESIDPIGLLAYLDEECMVSWGSDSTLLERAAKAHLVEKVPFESRFRLSHYASVVEYDVTGWIRKNRDVEAAELGKLVIVVSETADVAPVCDRKDAAYCNKAYSDRSRARGTSSFSNSAVRKGIFRTVAQVHRENLRRLLSALRATQPHFVRCILPNRERVPLVFDRSLVLQQLRCNGVLEGIRVARLGFPTRIGYREFLARYSLLCDGTTRCEVIPQKVAEGEDASLSLSSRFISVDPEEASTATETKAVLHALAVPESEYRLGRTRVFFRQGVVAALEERRDSLLASAAATVRKLLRTRLAAVRAEEQKRSEAAQKALRLEAKRSMALLRWRWWTLIQRVAPLLDVKKSEVAAKQLAEERSVLRAANEHLVSRQQVLEKELSQALAKREELEHHTEQQAAILGGLRAENARLLAEVQKKEREMARLKANIEAIREEKSEREKEEMRRRREKSSKEPIISARVRAIIDAAQELSQAASGLLPKTLAAQAASLSDRKAALGALAVLRNELADARAAAGAAAAENAQLAARAREAESREKRTQREAEQQRHLATALEAHLARLRAQLISSETLQEEEQSNSAAAAAAGGIASGSSFLTKSMSSSISDSSAEGAGTVVLNCRASSLDNKYQDGAQRKSGSVSSLMVRLRAAEEERDALSAANAQLAQSRLDELFKCEAEFALARAGLRAQLRRLEVENAKLKAELESVSSASAAAGNASGCSLSADSSSSDELYALLEAEREKATAACVRASELEARWARLEAEAAARKAEISSIERRCIELENRRQSQAALSEVSYNSRTAKKLREQLEDLKRYTEMVFKTFMKDFVGVLKRKESAVQDAKSEVAKLLKETAKLRAENEMAEYATKKAESDRKKLEVAKRERDAARLSLAVAEQKTKELAQHASKLERAFEDREQEIETMREQLREAALAVAECREREDIVRDFDEDNDEDAGDGRAGEQERKNIDDDKKETLRGRKIESIRRYYASRAEEAEAECAKLRIKLAAAEAALRRAEEALAESGGLKTKIEHLEESLSDEKIRAGILLNRIGVLRQSLESLERCSKSERLVSSLTVDEGAARALLLRRAIDGSKSGDREQDETTEGCGSNCPAAISAQREVTRLSAELDVLQLKLTQAEQRAEESAVLLDGMRTCMSYGRKPRRNADNTATSIDAEQQ